MLELEGHRPFDHFLTNHFLTLQGSKFSTSRGHMIWAGDIVEKTPATSDAVRYFLAKVNPERRLENFDLDEFVKMNNEFLVGQMQELVFAGIEAMHAARRSRPSLKVQGQLKQEVLGQREAFRASAFSMQRASESINGWVARQRAVPFASPSDAYWWIKGLAFLSAPIMPSFSVALWWVLGHEGVPNIDELFEESMPREWQGRRPFSEISIESLRPCLPHAVSVIGHWQEIGE
ncbi:class I tRNA ligase family protein [Acidisphaera sp. S103]|uniref:class I tRNA ligase family protein n=1 Tax=Acidisphaera sp. S103 TaxID=1747223 RepID=UPI001C20B51A|nr:class I tRNA ligase family protein [Acidisphaera sp. S103]